MTTTTLDLTGEVVRPGDAGYAAARLGWNRLYQRHPQAIVFCHTTIDVGNAVRWARSTGSAFRARSGRHNLEGWSSVDGGLVIDVSRMKSIEFDAAAGTATVGTGLVQKEIVAALGKHGYTIPTGSEGGVGLGGVVLGGGFGLLTRSMGLACDQLVAADIVVADVAFLYAKWSGSDGSRAASTTGSSSPSSSNGPSRPRRSTAPTPSSNYFLSSFGGAVRHEPPGGSAFPHRDALFYCEPGAGWNGTRRRWAGSPVSRGRCAPTSTGPTSTSPTPARRIGKPRTTARTPTACVAHRRDRRFGDGHSHFSAQTSVSATEKREG